MSLLTTLLSTAGATGGTVTSVGTGGLATGGPITGTGTVTVTAAVQSDMETASSTSVAVVPGVQKYHPGHPKAWVFATGGGTINASYNVATFTKDSSGRVHVTLTVSFSSTAYHISCNTQWNQGGGCVVDNTVGTPQAAGTFYLLNLTTANSATDPNFYYASCHGDQ